MTLHSELCSRIVTERVRIKNARILDGDRLEWDRIVVRECPCGGIELNTTSARKDDGSDG